jgi:opacity protein-like surface antigen
MSDKQLQMNTLCRFMAISMLILSGCANPYVELRGGAARLDHFDLNETRPHRRQDTDFGPAVESEVGLAYAPRERLTLRPGIVAGWLRSDSDDVDFHAFHGGANLALDLAVGPVVLNVFGGGGGIYSRAEGDFVHNEWEGAPAWWYGAGLAVPLNAPLTLTLTYKRLQAPNQEFRTEGNSSVGGHGRVEVNENLILLGLRYRF